MRMFRVLFFLAAAAGLASAQPVVSAVANAASNILNGFPNSALAEGSIAVAYGQGLGPQNLVTAPGLPWPKELAGTSAQITAGGQVFDLPLYYTSATQIAFLLPSSVPGGGGTIRVTYNGETSAQYNIPTTVRNVGVFTLNSRGTGQAIITYPDYTIVSRTPADDCGPLLTFCGAANPGDVLILWVTGIGPVSFEGDETTTPLAGDNPEIPLNVLIGGVAATVTYRGRSGCCVGEDQIVFVVPEGIVGCQVPIAVQVGGAVSNYAQIPIAAEGRACVPAAPDVPPETIQQLAAINSPRIGLVELDRSLSFQGNRDRGEADFFRVNAPGPMFAAAVDEAPIDTCRVAQFYNDFGPQGDDPFNALSLDVLDAGPSIDVSSGGRNRTLMKGEDGTFSADLGDATPGNFLDPGVYMVTGTGGADVGAFVANVTVPEPVVWTNPPNPNVPVQRATGLTITWTGGDPDGTISITGASQVNSNIQGAPPVRGVQFNCRVRAAPGMFFIPDSVLRPLPAYNPNNPGQVWGYMAITGFSSFTPLQAPGLDVGIAHYIFEGDRNQVLFQ